MNAKAVELWRLRGITTEGELTIGIQGRGANLNNAIQTNILKIEHRVGSTGYLARHSKLSATGS